MNRIAAALLLLLACRASGDGEPDVTGETYAARAREMLVGTHAPDAGLALLDGGRIPLADLLGRKPVYLKFWETWCVPCREQMPHLEAAYRKYGDRIAVYAVDLGINDPVETIRRFRAEHALTVPIAVDDGSLAELFHVSVTPQHVLIDRGGVVRYIGHGATAELDRALAALLDEDRASSPPPRPGPSPRVDAPLSLTLLDGSTFTLPAHAGQPVALTFVTASCDTYLAESRPTMAAACAAHARQVEAVRKTAPDVTWVTIAHPVWTTTESLVRYRERLNLTTPIGLDETASWFHRFRIRDVPTTIFFDRRGAEVRRVGGRGDDLAPTVASLR